MAGGHVYRARKSEHVATPTNAASENSPCQPGAVHTLSIATMLRPRDFWSQTVHSRH